jgi:hypothetical protein
MELREQVARGRKSCFLQNQNRVKKSILSFKEQNLNVNKINCSKIICTKNIQENPTLGQ